MPTLRPLRVVHVAGTAYGAPWMIAMLRELKALGHDVTAVIASGPGTVAPSLDGLGIPWIAADLDLFTARSPLHAFRKTWSLVRLLRRLKPDVVHSHLFPTLVITRMAAWLADVPVRVSMNCGPYHLQSPVFRDIETGLAWMDTVTVASCERTRRLMVERGIPASQVELIYYAVDQSGHDPALADGTRVRRELDIAVDEPVVGQVAYFYAVSTNPLLTPPGVAGRGVKGHDVIVRAAPLVLKELPRTKFVFVGSGWGEGGEAHKREIEELVRTLGLSDSFLFAGERRDVPDLLASFDVALQCSLDENLGGSVEALLLARPTVASRVGGLVDTVRHERTGLTVPPDDPEALAGAILRLLRDRPLGERLGREGRALMLERFSLRRTVADVEALYQRQASTSPRGHRRPRTAARLVLLPFRVLPLARRVVAALSPRQGGLAGALVRRVAHRALKREPRPARSSSPRVAQIAAASYGSGWFVDIVSELARRGHDVVAVIDSSPGDLGERLRRAGVRTRTVPMVFGDRFDRLRWPLYLLGLPVSAARLAWILWRERIDVAHSHVFVANLVTRLARVLAPVRHVAGIAGPRHLEARLTRRTDRMTWWLDDVTAAGSRHTLGLYRELGARPERLECVYYGADAGRFVPSPDARREGRRALGLDETAPLVGLVAWFYPPSSGPQSPDATRGVGVKGHETFLEAARLVARRTPEARFVLVGKGANARGEAYRASLRAWCLAEPLLRDRVLFPGHAEDVARTLAALDVAVQCSITENLGGTIEALLMERPLVATRAGGMPESVRDGETGLLVEVGDAEALAAAVERLLRDRELALRLGRAGRALMLERFTLAKTGDALEALYARLRSGGAGSSAPAGARP